MKFDVIVTNPPFQDPVKRKKTPHKLWIDFTLAVFDRLLKDGGSLVQVSPASFSSPSNVVLTLLEENQTNVLRLDTEHHFPNVASTFSDYWIVKQRAEASLTKIVRRDEEFEIGLSEAISYLPNDVCRLAMAIHSKVMFAPQSRLPVEWDYVACHNIRRYDDAPTLAEHKTPRHSYPIFHTNNKTWWSSVRQEWAESAKVMWTRSGYTKPFFDDGEHGGTDMVYFVRVPSSEQGRFLALNLNTMLMQYIYKTAKWSGFGNERVFAGLPDLPRDRALSDNEMFDHFNLSQEESEYVTRTLVPRRRKNARA